jgi:hypothetical protein
MGWPWVGKVLRWSVVLTTLALLWKKRHRPLEGILSPVGYCLIASCLLLFSPRSESPTFILIAPAYLFLTRLFYREKKPDVAWALLALCLFWITFAFNDLWPKAVWDPRSWNYASKVFGIFGIWGILVFLLAQKNRGAEAPQEILQPF